MCTIYTFNRNTTTFVTRLVVLFSFFFPITLSKTHYIGTVYDNNYYPSSYFGSQNVKLRRPGKIIYSRVNEKKTRPREPPPSCPYFVREIGARANFLFPERRRLRKEVCRRGEKCRAKLRKKKKKQRATLYYNIRTFYGLENKNDRPF